MSVRKQEQAQGCEMVQNASNGRQYSPASEKQVFMLELVTNERNRMINPRIKSNLTSDVQLT